MSAQVDNFQIALLNDDMRLSNPRKILALLPKRKKTDNKTAGGKCLIIAGSASMPGAAILAAKAAARVGAGYVYLYFKSKLNISQAPPDFILVKSDKIKFSKFSSIAIGPGLGTHSQASRKIIKWIQELKKAKAKNVVVDADALTVLAQNQNLLPLPSTWIVTPHTGELSRILKLKKSMTSKERKDYLLPAQKKLGCVLLLKGNPTYIFDGKKTYAVKAGNKALAKAGTGDVLTGMVAGFLSQGLETTDAATLAASLHGLMADEWIKSKDYLSFMASDLIELLPATLFKLRK